MAAHRRHTAARPTSELLELLLLALWGRHDALMHHALGRHDAWMQHWWVARKCCIQVSCWLCGCDTRKRSARCTNAALASYFMELHWCIIMTNICHLLATCRSQIGHGTAIFCDIGGPSALFKSPAVSKQMLHLDSKLLYNKIYVWYF